MEKILAQPNERAKAEELGRQIHEMLNDAEDNQAVLSGILSSAVLGIMNVREYADCLCAAFNQLCAIGKLPISMINYADWYDTKDFTQEQRLEWLEQKNEQWRRKQKRIIAP